MEDENLNVVGIVALFLVDGPSLPPGSAPQLLAFPQGSWSATWTWTSSHYLISTDHYRTFSHEVEMVILYRSGAFFFNWNVCDQVL